MLDKGFLEELRTRLTLSEVVGRRVKLTRNGREFKACCPFHNEKTPSFYVNDAKGFFHCFGCGAHGDVVGFRMRHDNLGFMEAVEGLASEAGLQMPKADPKAAEKFDEYQRLMQIMERVTKWFQVQLQHPQNGFALRYLQERGLSNETIAQFRLGYAPNNWDALREALIAEGIKAQDLITLGLLKQSSREDKADKPYSFFRGRVMFPVTDTKGRVIAFSGRHLDAAFTGQALTEKPPKYINSGEHALFHKGGVLYGLARARALVNSANPLLLVEGQMDVITLVQAGLGTAVAPLGTALTEEHMMLAWKVSPPDAPPILSFDGDTAGQNAAYRALEKLLPHLTAQKGLKLVFMPEGEDPDSLIRKNGLSAVNNLIHHALGAFDALWQRELMQTQNTPEGKAAMQSRLDAQIARVKDPLLQQNYRQTLRDRMYQLGRPAASKRFGSKTALPSPVKLRKLSNTLETRGWQVILAAAINHPFVLNENLEALGMASAPDPDLEIVRETLVTLVHQSHSEDVITAEAVREFLSNRGLDNTVASLLHDSIYQLFGFARPETPPDQVSEGWKDVWTRMQLKTVTHDKTKLLQAVRSDYSDEMAERLFALSQQEQNLLDETL